MRNLRPANAATNFRNPVLSVQRAVQRGIIRPQDVILEIGAGNLRNAAYVLDAVSDVTYFAFDIPECVSRFADRYRALGEQGVIVLEQGYEHELAAYDVVICTFVLETICPETTRTRTLEKISNALKRTGCLIVSFRGYPGVRGSAYRLCDAGEGLITPLKTFVRPYSVPEAGALLRRGGFLHVEMLQQYQVELPENIHLVARFEEGGDGPRLD
jgi:SAM-dependent methyltransferase